MTNEQSEQIRQKAREFAQMWSLRKESERASNESTISYETRYLAAFAESLLSGEMAITREFDISVRCGHCNTINYAVRSLAELGVNERGAAPPAASPSDTWITYDDLSNALKAANQEIIKLTSATCEGQSVAEEALRSLAERCVFDCENALDGDSLYSRILLALQEAVNMARAASGGQHSVIVTKNAEELLQATSGSGTPATPNAPHLRPQVPEWDHENQYEREKAIMDLQEKREQEAVAAAVAAEREQWQNWGIIELAVRNTNVASYVEHWEGRALKSEAALASLKAAGEGWIPCAERLPEDQQTVQIWLEKGEFPITAGFRITTNVQCFYSIPGGWQYKPTHWRPLPPAPAKPAEGPAAKEGK